MSQTSQRFSAQQQVCATQSSFAKSSDRREVCSLSILSEALELRRGLCSFRFPSPAWRNWQTRWTQNPVIARSCGFEPLRRQKLADFASKKALRTLLNTNILKLCSTERSLSAFFSQEDWFSPRPQHLLPSKVMF